MRPRKPGASENYDTYKVDDITVYLYKNAKVADTLKLKMAEYVSDLADKEIAVEGLETY